MNITPISFSGNIIDFNRISHPHSTIRRTQGDVFVRSSEEESKETVKSLNEFNDEIEELLKAARKKKISPDSAADSFIKILKNKELLESFESEMKKLDGMKEGDEPEIKPLEDFYALTFKMQNYIDDNVSDRNYAALVSMALTPYDNRYEDYCLRCSEIFGDDEDDEDRKVLDLSALVDIDREDASDEETKEVLKSITQFLSEEFEKNPEPEFDISIEIGEDYDEKKWINACTNLFKLITMERENSQKCDKN